MKNKLTVGIVILTYNSAEYITNCLKSILANDYYLFKCVIIDNNSTDDTINTVYKNYPDIKLIKNKINLGYAAGNNIGIRYLLRKRNISHILILNPDTLVSGNLIRELVDNISVISDAGIIGPIITYAHQPKKIWFAGGYLNRLFLYTKHINMNKKIYNTKSLYENTDFITGACILIRTEVFNKTGLIPEDYFMYFEDVDFCQKAIKTGYKCILLNKPLVKHHVSASAGKKGTNNLTPLRAYCFARNPFIYIRVNVKGWRKIANIFGQFAVRLPYYGIQMLLKRNTTGILAYLRGLKDGLFYKF